jgi:hypothetical protein
MIVESCLFLSSKRQKCSCEGAPDSPFGVRRLLAVSEKKEDKTLTVVGQAPCPTCRAPSLPPPPSRPSAAPPACPANLVPSRAATASSPSPVPHCSATTPAPLLRSLLLLVYAASASTMGRELGGVHAGGSHGVRATGSGGCDKERTKLSTRTRGFFTWSSTQPSPPATNRSSLAIGALEFVALKTGSTKVLRPGPPLRYCRCSRRLSCFLRSSSRCCSARRCSAYPRGPTPPASESPVCLTETQEDLLTIISEPPAF